MRALGVDPSLSSLGYCVYDSGAQTRPRRLVHSGHEGTMSDVIPAARFVRARTVVESLLRRFDVDVVGIESPAFTAGPFATTHFALMMFISEAVFNVRKDLVLFDPTTLKVLSTGKSNASKADMQKAVQLDRMSTEVIQADEADAYHVAAKSARFMMLKRGELVPDDLDDREKQVFLQRSKKDGHGRVRRTAHVFRQNSRYFSFSSVPEGSISLPRKEDINPALLDWLGHNEAKSERGELSKVRLPKSRVLPKKTSV
jgi:Holliday junction resolvasome RuvABC endonuclease subunit